MADWKDIGAVLLKAVLALAILAAAVCSILALVAVLALKRRLDPVTDPNVETHGLREGMVLPGKDYFIYVPSGGTAPLVKPCDTPNEDSCVNFNTNKFIPGGSGSYTSPYITVRFVRDDKNAAPGGASAGNPLKYGDRVFVFFVQQGMWFTGTGKMVSAKRADALSVPLTLPKWTQNGATYAAPDPDGYVTTASLVNFDQQADNSKGVPTHKALTNASYPAIIGEFIP